MGRSCLLINSVAGMCDLVVHSGGCHCGAVRFTVNAPSQLTVYRCNCSICEKKQNDHIIVPHSQFTLLQGEDSLTCYTFNTHQARHLFCKICGVQSFYQPRSNSNGYGVMPHCLDKGTAYICEIREFDGENWEKSMEAEKKKKESILSFSNQ